MKPLALIGLVGKKQSGKDTLFTELDHAARHRLLKAVPLRFAFADALKKELAEILGTDILHITVNKGILREALQNHGLERRKEDENYWLKKLDVSNINLNYPSFVVVTDVRFKNEAEKIKELGGKLIRIRRKATDDSGDNHPSETELESIVCDTFIYNDEGPLRLRYQGIDCLKQLFGDLLV